MMFRLLGLMLLTGMTNAFAGPKPAGPFKTKLETAPNVVWLGVDYTPARIFVPETFDDPNELVYFSPQEGVDEVTHRFASTKEVWEKLEVTWNEIAENAIRGDLENSLLREIEVDMPGPEGQTKKPAPYFESQYEYKVSPPNFDEAALQKHVKTYRTKNRDGIGYVFVVERISEIEKQACVWETFLDLKSKEVIRTQRICEKPGGSTFRSKWVKPILKIGKNTIKALDKGEL